jgi:thiamine biosynthesis lipoprotein ApbE
MQLKTIWLLTCLCYPFREARSSSPARPPVSNGPELLIGIELAVPSDTWVKRPYLAVWIENKDKRAIRTLALWYNKPRWIPELKAWYRSNYQRYDAKKEIFRPVTGATRLPGKYSLRWDGKDETGKEMPLGEYVLFIEVAREHSPFQIKGSYALIRKVILCNEVAKEITLKGNAEIKFASISYSPHLITNRSNALPGPGKSSHSYVSHYENVLGTSMDLKVWAASKIALEKAEKGVLQTITHMSKILSGYDFNSEFSQWCRTTHQPIAVSGDLFAVLTLFDQWRTRTDGALDAAAEAITIVWKQAATKGRLPSPDELSAAVQEVKQAHWKLDAKDKTATHLSNTSLMLNSFAKSYIIKCAADAGLAVHNVDAIVVNIGGDLVVAGKTTETIQISDPAADAENDSPIDQIELSNKAVATSGNYRRGERIGGRWYSHIVDPRTGQPADNITSATVVAPNATDAGALATAFNVMDTSESIRLAKTILGVEYLIITRTGRRITSPGWAALDVPQKTREKKIAPASLDYRKKKNGK